MSLESSKCSLVGICMFLLWGMHGVITGDDLWKFLPGTLAPPRTAMKALKFTVINSYFLCINSENEW